MAAAAIAAAGSSEPKAAPIPIPRLARVTTYNRDTNMTSVWIVALILRPPGKGTRNKSYEGRIVSQDLLKDVQVCAGCFFYSNKNHLMLAACCG